MNWRRNGPVTRDAIVLLVIAGCLDFGKALPSKVPAGGREQATACIEGVADVPCSCGVSFLASWSPHTFYGFVSARTEYAGGQQFQSGGAGYDRSPADPCPLRCSHNRDRGPHHSAQLPQTRTATTAVTNCASGLGTPG